MSRDQYGEGDGGSETRSSTVRPMRADAQRSTDALLAAAREVFASSGVDAPVREIAQKAGVGIGTVYRNFPHRADLIAAVFRREVDACADAARELADQHTPFEALSRWINRYVNYLATKRGLAAALYTGDPAYEALPGYFRQQLEPALQGLLQTAVEAGEVRVGTGAYTLLRAVGSLSAVSDGDQSGNTQHMVALLLDGLRYGTGLSANEAP